MSFHSAIPLFVPFLSLFISLGVSQLSLPFRSHCRSIFFDILLTMVQLPLSYQFTCHSIFLYHSAIFSSPCHSSVIRLPLTYYSLCHSSVLLLSLSLVNPPSLSFLSSFLSTLCHSIPFSFSLSIHSLSFWTPYHSPFPATPLTPAPSLAPPVTPPPAKCVRVSLRS